MRTRNIYNPISSGPTSVSADSYTWSTVNGSWILPPSNVTLGGSAFTTALEISKITDDPSSGRKTKYVDHNKIVHNINDISTVDNWFYDAGTGIPHGLRTFLSGPWANVAYYGVPQYLVIEDVEVRYDKEVDALKRQALHSFFNMDEVDNFTNVREGGQTVELVQSIIRGIDSGALILFDFDKSGRKRSLGSVKKFLKSRKSFAAISNLYLAYQFGVAPLLGDMRTLSKQARYLRPRLDKVVDASRKTVTVRAKSGGHVNVPADTLPDYGVVGDSGTYYTGSVNIVHSPVRSVYVSGKRAFTYNSRLFNRLDYLCSRFLSAGPASALWEAIPYSFVLDWFVDLSGVIDSLDNALTGNNKKITDMGLSEKWEILYATYVAPRATRYLTLDGDNYANTQLSHYHREAVTPDISIGSSGRFGKKQVCLLAALLHQLVAKLKV